MFIFICDDSDDYDDDNRVTTDKGLDESTSQRVNTPISGYVHLRCCVFVVGVAVWRVAEKF